MQRLLQFLKRLFSYDYPPAVALLAAPAKLIPQDLIAILVGHSRAGDNGAESIVGEDEWSFNREVAGRAYTILRGAGYNVVLIDHYKGNGYMNSVVWLGQRLRGLGAALCFELHFNSAAKEANGHEYIYYYTSLKGRDLAQCFSRAHTKIFPKSKSRGIKAVDRSGRGSLYLRKTPCPAIICEPFFGSNIDDWATYSGAKHELAQVYADACMSYLK